MIDFVKEEKQPLKKQSKYDDYSQMKNKSIWSQELVIVKFDLWNGEVNG